MTKNIASRILITIALLLIYRIGNIMIAPGLPVEELYKFFMQGDFNSYNTIKRFTLFGAGINQYVSATALMLIIAIFSKRIRNLLFGGPQQLHKLEVIIQIMTCALLVLASFGINTYLKSLSMTSIPQWTYGDNITDQVLFITARVCGGMIVLFIAQMITRAGIINGVIAIIFMDLFYNIKSDVFGFFNNKTVVEQADRFGQFIAIFAILALMVFCVIFILLKRNITVYDEKSEVAEKQFQFPIRLNTTGTIPPEIASALIAMVFFQMPSMFGISYAMPDILYYTVLIILSIVLAYIFAYMSFNPKFIVAALKRFGYALPGKNEITSGENYLGKIYKPITALSALLITLLALSPLLMEMILKNSKHFLMQFSGTCILMLCCVIIDVKNRFKQLTKINGPMVNAAQFNTQLEAELFTERLSQADINGVIINNRALPQTGTLAYYEICMPSIPYLINHRYLGGGTVAVYVQEHELERVNELLQDYAVNENIFNDDNNDFVESNDPDLTKPEDINSDELFNDVKNSSRKNQDETDAKNMLKNAKKIARQINKKK